VLKHGVLFFDNQTTIMRKIALLLAVLLCGMMSVFAQSVVRGKVTDEKSGQPISGATIKVKGGRETTTSKADGTFEINAKSGSSLEITEVGHLTQTIKISGAGDVDVKLQQDSKGLTEVVVTALGIKREKKALGYTVSTVNKKDLEQRPEGDIARVLNGKAPGVNILNTSGLSGSGTNIVIRAIGTITGNSQPLFVVDGVPFNGSTNDNSNFTFGNQNSSRFLDLDPNNIENVSVLKGLSATTLYGEFGRNGVILITTKNGNASKANKKTEITLTQSYFVNQVANLPEYNTKYGGGFDLSNGVTFFSNWGGPFSNPPVLVPHPYSRTALNAAFPEFVGATYEYKQYKNNVRDFFRKGSVVNTSLNVSGGTGTSGYNANFSYLKDIGFTVGNEFDKITFGIGGSSKLSNNFTVNGSFNYVATEVTSPPTSTSFGSSASNSSVFGDVMYTPTSVDLMGLPFQNPLDGSHVYYRTNNGIQNPRWTLENAFTANAVNRAYGNIALKYDFRKNFNITYRVGYDNYSERQLYAQNKGGAYTPDGILRSSTGNNTIWDQNLILNFTKDLTNSWKLGIDGGFNVRNDIYAQTGILSQQQLVFGLMNHSNFINHQPLSEDGSSLDYKSELQTVGLYVQAQAGFKDYLFFNLGARQGWTSALEKENRSIFYPGGSVSFIPTSFVSSLQNSKNINYLKVRAGYATSAEFPGVYSTRPVLGIATKVFVDGGGNSINTNSIANRLPNLALKPSLVKEFEAGIEGKFFDNRVSLDLTWYNRTNADQLLDRDLDPSTGYTVQRINAGKVTNKGIEMALGYTVIRNSKFRWQLDALFARNRSMVSDLPEDLKEIRTAGYTNLGNFAINGQPLGVIKGRAFQRADNGERLVAANGWYLVDNDISILGDPNPDYKLTGISNFSYKNLSFRIQMEYTHGGDMYSATSSVLLGRGVTRDTEFDRALPVILPGVTDQEGKVTNTRQISSTEAYFNNTVAGSAADEPGIYDATHVRIREASLSYSLPQGWLKKLPFGSVSLTVSGNNLWYYAPNFPKYVNFDPETSGLGVSNGRGLEFFTGPSARRFGASLRVTF
jgi:TonB-linked SusC/RagA family outer membrane protein